MHSWLPLMLQMPVSRRPMSSPASVPLACARTVTFIALSTRAWKFPGNSDLISLPDSRDSADAVPQAAETEMIAAVMAAIQVVFMLETILSASTRLAGHAVERVSSGCPGGGGEQGGQ